MCPDLAKFIRLRIGNPDTGGCRPWLGVIDPGHGYGQMTDRSTGRRRTLLAHRMVYELFRGPIPPGAWVLHRCDNRWCVNPEHLFLGTAGDNNTDRCRKGRNDDRRGARNPQAKLGADDIRAIRASPEMQKDIAVQYGLHKSTVSQIISRKLWPHVT